MSDFVHGNQAEVRLPQKHQGREIEDCTNDVGSPDSFSKQNTPTEYAESEEKIKARELQQNHGFLRRLRHGEQWLDRKMGIETQGVDRIPEDNKRPPSILNVFFLWWSLTCHVGTIPIGVLGPQFGLSLRQSVAAIVVGTFLGALCTSYTGTLGPKLGLRQIACSRYSFGFWGAKVCSVLNVLVGGGFMVVNTVVVGQILSAVSNYTMTIEAGIIIISVLSYVVSVFGFALIHTFEKYSWIVCFILLCVLYGEVAPSVNSSIPSLDHGIGSSAAFLSFMAICFSSASGWCSIASDYYCNYPSNTKSWKIFFLTLAGICIPTIFTTVLGACLGNAAISSTTNSTLSTAYTNHGLGGLLREAYHPLHFSKFALVILTFSVLGNNVAVNYSSGLSLQLLGHYFHAIPRFIWSFVNGLVIAIIAIAGRQHLSTIVEDFVSLLGYWTVSFTIILLVEDKVFRRRTGYDLLIWDVPSRLPVGAAAVLALLTGYLAGGVTGMAQTWYIGPIAAKFGGHGGDVGIYLSLILTLLVYPPLRYFEKLKFGR